MRIANERIVGACAKIFQLKLSEFSEIVLRITLWHVLNQPTRNAWKTFHLHVYSLAKTWNACVTNCDVASIQDVPNWYHRIKLCRIKSSVSWNTINYDMAPNFANLNYFRWFDAWRYVAILLILKIQQNFIWFFKSWNFEKNVSATRFTDGLRHQPSHLQQCVWHSFLNEPKAWANGIVFNFLWSAKENGQLVCC